MSRTARTRLWLPRAGTVVRNLIAGLGAAYVAQLILENWLGVPIVDYLALVPQIFAPWQLVTYVFVDRSHPVMFVLGLLFIYWALAPFERDLGPRRALQLCAVVVIAASVPAYLFGFVIPGASLLAGSSPLWLGGITATAWLYRDQPLSLFGVLTLTARQLLYVLLGLSALNFLASKNHTQLVADLGAMGGAALFARYLQRPRRRPPSKRPKPRPSGLRVIEGGGSGDDRPKWLN
jgi:membrane associated rhomboid family serine protease